MSKEYSNQEILNKIEEISEKAGILKCKKIVLDYIQNIIKSETLDKDILAFELENKIRIGAARKIYKEIGKL